MKPRFDITPQERWARVGELLYKGIYLLEMEKRSKEAPQLIQPVKEDYTPQEAAEFLGVSHRTIQRWVSNGRLLPKRKPNGYIILSQADLKKAAVNFLSKDTPLTSQN